MFGVYAEKLGITKSDAYESKKSSRPVGILLASNSVKGLAPKYIFPNSRNLLNFLFIISISISRHNAVSTKNITPDQNQLQYSTVS